MRSIRRSFMVLMVATIVSLCLIMGGVGVFFLVKQSDEDAKARLSLSCAKEASDINLLLNEIQTAVKDEVSCVADDLAHPQEPTGASWRPGAERLFGNIASHTKGAVLYYVRVEDDAASGTSEDGFYYYRTSVDDEFVQKDDWEDVPGEAKNTSAGWNRRTLQSGTALWIEPIDYTGNGMLTALYVAPVMVNGVYRGYVAMGIDFSVVGERVAASKLYGNGYAYLVDADENVMYHPILKTGSNLQGDNECIPEVDEALANANGEGRVIAYKYHGDDKRMTFQVLDNNMRLVVTANAAEIYQQRNHLVAVFVVVGVAAVLLSALMTMQQTRYVLAPLESLTKAAQRAAQGDVDVRILAPNVEEVRDLAKAYNKTVDRMRAQIDLIDNLAHLDQLTGLKNRTAFYEVTKELNERIAAGDDVSFEAVMFDVNDLKIVNDYQGHVAGDALLRRAAEYLAKTFEGYDVYRFGGDEFVLICEDELGDLEQRMAGGDVSIAWGCATFAKGEDASVSAVLGRADVAMYERKRSMKQGDKA